MGLNPKPGFKEIGWGFGWGSGFLCSLYKLYGFGVQLVRHKEGHRLSSAKQGYSGTVLGLGLGEWIEPTFSRVLGRLLEPCTVAQ